MFDALAAEKTAPVRTLLVAGLLALAWPAQGEAVEPGEPAAPQAAATLLDDFWIPRDELDARARRGLAVWCDGVYRPVAAPYPTDVDAATLPTQAEADRATYVIDERIDLEGDVFIRRGNRTVRTDAATLFEDSERAELRGSVRLADPTTVLVGATADIDLDTQAASLAGVEYLLPESGLRGDADRVTRSGDGDLHVDDGSVTRCEPGSNLWRIDARSIDVADGAVFGTARRATVRIKDVPVFYLPWIRFPVKDDRQSGWLFPNIGFGGEDGFDFSAPYYFNLAPNYDATLTPRILTKRGFMLEGEARHLSTYGVTEIGGAILRHDDRFDGELDRSDFNELGLTEPFDEADRWLYRVQHQGGRGDWQTIVDYAAVSDPDYFRDLGTGLAVSSQVELERRGEIRYRRNNFGARLWAQRFQRLDDIFADVYQRVPQLDLDYSVALPRGLRLTTTAQAVSFDRDVDGFTGTNRITGERYHLQPELRLPLRWPYAFIDVTGGYRATRYNLKNVPVGVDDEPERNIGYASFDGGLFFERDTRLLGRDMIQTLEPRLFYLYQERADQANLPRFDASPLTFSYNQLFRLNRFAGIDRIGDASQVSVGVSTAFVDARSGREVLRASIGEIFHLRDRTVTLSGAPGADERQSTSALAGQLSSRLWRRWSVTASFVYDHHDNELDLGGFAANYRSDNRHIFNVGIRKNRIEDLVQTDISVVWPLTRRWSAIGRWNQDIERNRTIDGFVGLEYNDCCWQFRLIGRRFIENPSTVRLDRVDVDEGVFFQFVFKGLAGFGTKVDQLMQRSIRGFRANDQ
ncbi:MAG: LPS-assembly protein LptD [Pseudomonadota bacterium]